VQLLKMFLNGMRLDSRFPIEDIAANLEGVSPADLQAICAAKRMAFNRLSGDQLPPLNRSAFDRAAQRVLSNKARHSFHSAF
jgi:hypothetical protein